MHPVNSSAPANTRAGLLGSKRNERTDGHPSRAVISQNVPGIANGSEATANTKKGRLNVTLESYRPKRSHHAKQPAAIGGARRNRMPAWRRLPRATIDPSNPTEPTRANPATRDHSGSK